MLPNNLASFARFGVLNSDKLTETNS